MLLTMLSSSMRDGRPLPPYMPHPRAYDLTRRLEEWDKNILSVRHVNEPGYAAFAVLQLSARCIELDMEKLIDRIKDLVGELDFSFRVEHSTGESAEGSREDLDDIPHKSKGD